MSLEVFLEVSSHPADFEFAGRGSGRDSRHDGA